ncbi:DMT family transporter [Pseudotabrizicola sp. L79]|uniref:DMT family transporter n=1 Tax=Pseudotabrizicola sp. L79 TaxID=3118402 RepID=UPI002F920995
MTPLPTASETARGIALMLLAILCFTAMDAAAKGLIQRYPVPQVVWARFLGQVLIVGLILRGAVFAALRTRYPVQHLIRSACQLGATGCFFASLPHIGLAEATALTDLNPVFITLGAALFLGEKLGPRRIAGVIAAMIGAMIVIRPGAAVFTPAALLPLCAALFYTANALYTRHLGPRESHWTPMLLAALFGTLATSTLQPFVWQPVAMADLPIFVLIGILGTAAQLCLIRAFTVAEAGAVAPFAYVGILFATGWGIVLYDEWPDLPTLIGALVIVAAGVYVWHRETKGRQPQPTE